MQQHELRSPKGATHNAFTLGAKPGTAGIDDSTPT